MHELAICQELLKQATAIAHQHQAQAVSRITIQLGPLSGVEPELLQRAFPLARAGSCADRAQLLIETLPVRVRCQRCSQESETRANQLRCLHCGDFRTELISGDELILARLEMTTEHNQPRLVS